jgi:hypothetical protein
MLLNDLIAKLEETRDAITDTLGDDAAAETEIRLAIQPSYPMQHATPKWETDLPWRVEDDGPSGRQVIAYLAEAGQVHDAPYLPGDIAEALGWS